MTQIKEMLFGFPYIIVTFHIRAGETINLRIGLRPTLFKKKAANIKLKKTNFKNRFIVAQWLLRLYDKILPNKIYTRTKYPTKYFKTKHMPAEKSTPDKIFQDNLSRDKNIPKTK